MVRIASRNAQALYKQGADWSLVLKEYGSASHVEKFKSDVAVEAGVYLGRGNVNADAHAGEPASAFDSAGEHSAQADSFHSLGDDELSGFYEKSAGRSYVSSFGTTCHVLVEAGFANVVDSAVVRFVAAGFFLGPNVFS